MHPDCDTPETRTHKDITANDFVPQRMKPSTGIHLGCPVQRVLQGTHRIGRSRSTRGGASHLHGTHRAPPSASARIDTRSGPSLTPRLCCPAGSIGTTAASDSLPTDNSLPRITGYRASPLPMTTPPNSGSQIIGPGRASPVPVATIDTFHAPYAGEFVSTCTSRSSVPSIGLHRDFGGSALSSPPPSQAGTSNDAAGFASCCGPHLRSPLQGF